MVASSVLPSRAVAVISLSSNWGSPSTSKCSVAMRTRPLGRSASSEKSATMTRSELPGFDCVAVIVGCVAKRRVLAILDTNDRGSAVGVSEFELPGGERLIDAEVNINGNEARRGASNHRQQQACG